ncbi:asparagine synthase (glutamine-hydrolyzing) [Marinomonas sp.]|uniref:asparagine synthase (glutamine-hydrolyzing) n=1 Tax=Marinomonas sp. TaxID=1904862 RepID=UPI003A91D754
MCGFAGFYRPEGLVGPVDDVLVKMGEAIIHRGPDAGGVWASAEKGIAFSHRRLAIVDLSDAGKQPMHSATGRFTIAFNGEIYNHLELRAELKSEWRGHSDTETLLASIEAWGIEKTLKASRGMFAFALWDHAEQTLTLTRDRLGEKPLYYGWTGDTLLFGSELASFKAFPGFSPEVNRQALVSYLRHGYVKAPLSILEGVGKLMPGTFKVFHGRDRAVEKCYWSASDVILQGQASPFSGSADDAVEQLDMLLSHAISQQMLADVPLGAFLSGGVDSSTIVALMQAQSSRPVRTFSIGFHDKKYNEAEHAKAVAKHLNTEHTELYLTPEDVLGLVPDLATYYSEPFADASQLPTLAVSQMARKHVTVALSGDAGDEMFHGYSRYDASLRLWGKLSALPAVSRKAAASVVGSLPVPLLNRVGKFVGKSYLGDKVNKSTSLFRHSDFDRFYHDYLLSHYRDPAKLVIDGSDPHALDLPEVLRELPLAKRMMASDVLSYLPDDILTKVDRAAMSASLETRVPLLDHRIVEFASGLPMEFKQRDGMSKWPLRQLLYRHVPRELIERPKKGFSVPLDSWLRGPLRSWAEDLLRGNALNDAGYFDVAEVDRLWQEHLTEQRNWSAVLWSLLVFLQWHKQFFTA